MRLPIIKHLVENPEFDEDYFIETVDVLVSLADARGIKDEELDVIGELVSNLEGAIDVKTQIKEGTPQKEALNNFMKKVTGAISNLNN
jgi:nucleotide-binding universal stress UspA family protein